MSHDIRALHEHVESCARAGDVSGSLPRLDEAIAAEPQRADLRFLRASVLLALQRPAPALADLDQLLAVDPAADPARFQRALTLAGLERLGEALEDFLELSRRRPEKVESWANAGMILLRMERYAEAIPHLRRAAQMSPANMQLRRSLANALSGDGVLAEAMPLFESVVRATPRDPAALTDYAMALMSAGRPRDAHAQLLAALRVDPTDQTALAGLYLSGNELGMGELVDQLMDYPRLLSPMPRPEGIALDREALREAVLAHPGLVWQPAGRSTWQGRQSPMLDLSPGSPFADFGAMVRHVVDERLAAVRADPALRGHPWTRTLPTRWRLQAWCTVLESGGRQTPHIHPAGRLSGVYYLDTGDAPGPGAGTLTFGHAPDSVAMSAAPRQFALPPREDWICCFPSYFFHHTEPFQGTTRPRISLAFDVMPAG